MNILHIAPQGEFGGAARITLDWIRHSELRHVAVVGGGGPVVALLERQGCTVHSVRPWRPRNVWPLVAEVAAIADREKIDLIHSCNCDGHLLGGLLRLKTARPEMWFNHGPIERVAWSRFARFIPTDALLVGSRSMERAQRRLGYWAKSLSVHRLGIDCEAFKADAAARATTRARLGLRDEICLAMVARFEPGKGQALLAGALAEIRHRRPDLPFKIIFVGGMLGASEAHEYERNVKELVGTLGLNSSAIFTGHADNVSDYINAADIVVLASIVAESFGLAVLEGMAMEKATVAPNEGGPGEIISDGKDGYLFPARDSDLLANLLETVMNDVRHNPDRLAALGAAARRKVCEHYDIATSARELEKVYRSLVVVPGKK